MLKRFCAIDSILEYWLIYVLQVLNKSKNWLFKLTNSINIRVKNRIPKKSQSLFFNNRLVLVRGFISIIDIAVSIGITNTYTRSCTIELYVAPINANWHPTPKKTRIADNNVYIIFLDVMESIAPKIMMIENIIKNKE